VVIPNPDIELAGPPIECPDTYPQVGATGVHHVLSGPMFLQSRPKDGRDGHMVLEFQDLLGWRLFHLPSGGLRFHYTPD